jgi:hypothetical protein
MIYLPYTLESLTPKSVRRYSIALCALLPIAAAPILIVLIQRQAGRDTRWFSDWLNPLSTSHDFVCGLYCLVSGLAILLFLKIGGHYTLKIREYDVEQYRSATHPRWGVGGVMFYGTLAGTLIMGLGVMRLCTALVSLLAI